MQRNARTRWGIKNDYKERSSYAKRYADDDVYAVQTEWRIVHARNTRAKAKTR